jgi:hypothetical protein
MYCYCDVFQWKDSAARTYQLSDSTELPSESDSPTQTEGSDKPSSVNFILSMGRLRRARAERSSGEWWAGKIHIIQLLQGLLLASLDSYSGHCRAAGYLSYIIIPQIPAIFSSGFLRCFQKVIDTSLQDYVTKWRRFATWPFALLSLLGTLLGTQPFLLTLSVLVLLCFTFVVKK